jgi:hypothetical protein
LGCHIPALRRLFSLAVADGGKIVKESFSFPGSELAVWSE